MSLLAILAPLALQAGLPVLEKILSQKIGDAGGHLAAEAIRAIADRMRVDPEELAAQAETYPGAVIEVMREVERMTPEMVALYAADAQLQIAALQADQERANWVSAWRPLGMYFIMFLWLWNAVLLHSANAIWKIALPVVPWDVLMGLSALYFSLYMGGHTVKDVVAKWVGK